MTELSIEDKLLPPEKTEFHWDIELITENSPSNTPCTPDPSQQKSKPKSGSRSGRVPEAEFLGRRRRLLPDEMVMLNNIFDTVTQKPDAKLRHKLSEKMGISSRSIQVWFQNRRAKIKKESNQSTPLGINSSLETPLVSPLEHLKDSVVTTAAALNMSPNSPRDELTSFSDLEKTCFSLPLAPVSSESPPSLTSAPDLQHQAFPAQDPHKLRTESANASLHVSEVLPGATCRSFPSSGSDVVGSKRERRSMSLSLQTSHSVHPQNLERSNSVNTCFLPQRQDSKQMPGQKIHRKSIAPVFFPAPEEGQGPIKLSGSPRGMSTRRYSMPTEPYSRPQKKQKTDESQVTSLATPVSLPRHLPQRRSSSPIASRINLSVVDSYFNPYIMPTPPLSYVGSKASILGEVAKRMKSDNLRQGQRITTLPSSSQSSRYDVIQLQRLPTNLASKSSTTAEANRRRYSMTNSSANPHPSRNVPHHTRAGSDLFSPLPIEQHVGSLFSAFHQPPSIPGTLIDEQSSSPFDSSFANEHLPYPMPQHQQLSGTFSGAHHSVSMGPQMFSVPMSFEQAMQYASLMGTSPGVFGHIGSAPAPTLTFPYHSTPSFDLQDPSRTSFVNSHMPFVLFPPNQVTANSNSFFSV